MVLVVMGCDYLTKSFKQISYSLNNKKKTKANYKSSIKFRFFLEIPILLKYLHESYPINLSVLLYNVVACCGLHIDLFQLPQFLFILLCV